MYVVADSLLVCWVLQTALAAADRFAAQHPGQMGVLPENLQLHAGQRISALS
jgi:hypothetical protein